MRIWTLHPKYLDSKGLVALWREALLAKNVLEGKTKGYKNHPQLIRFKNSQDPIKSINKYLEFVYIEACERKYNFNKEKIKIADITININVKKGQLNYEALHLLKKLKYRNPLLYNNLKSKTTFDPHPIFNIVEGGIESWEIIDDF